MTSLVIASARRLFLVFRFPRPELDDNVRHCSLLRLLKIATESLAVLLVGNLLHPFDHLPILLFLNSDVCHGSGLRGAMPVLLTGRDQTTSPGLISSIGPPSR